MNARARVSNRREPAFEAGAGDDGSERGFDLRLSPEDRPGARPRPRQVAPAEPEARRGRSDRREPRFDPAYDDPEPEIRERPRRARGGGGGGDDRGRDDGGRGRGRGRRRPEGSRFGRLVRRLVYWGLFLGVWAVVAVAAFVGYHAAHLPPTSEWAVPKRPPNVRIVSVDGAVLGNRGEAAGESVRLEELPPYLPKALMAVEDRRFHQHFGVDPLGLARAVVVNLTSGQLTQGGSTITQQLAKNLFLTQDRTIGRKVQELVLSLWLEHNYTKNHIMEMYLNRVYFGSGAYGVDAAAQRYFKKSARQLTKMEAAMLVGLLKAPSRFSPARDPVRSRERALTVLAAMVDAGYMTDEERKAAIAAPAVPVHRQVTGSENYVADWVMDLVPTFLGALEQDVVVETTIDSTLQLLAEGALQFGLAQFGDKRDVSQGAIVAVDPAGAVKAMVGGADYAESQFNRAVQAKRQPGSTFKPFVYLAAVEAGLTPETIRVDRPVTIGNWKPQNYSKEFKGPVSLKDALAMSLNTVAAQLAAEVGPKRIVAAAHRLGIGSELRAEASIALGTSEVTPLEITGAFVPFSNGGYGVAPHVVTRITDAKGRVLYQRPAANVAPVIDPRALKHMNTMLQETLTTGTARKAALPGMPAGGKTGTSQDFRDAWFIGYTAYLTAGVWLGNDDNSPTNKATGGSYAAVVWQKFMADAHRGATPLQIPGMDYVPEPAPVDPGAPVAGQPGPVPPANVGASAPARPAVRPPAVHAEDSGRPIPPPPGNGSMDQFLKRLFGG